MKTKLLAQFPVACRVRILRVAFPELAHHARFIGQEGTVTKTVKCRHVVCVQTSAGLRECFPENLELLPA